MKHVTADEIWALVQQAFQRAGFATPVADVMAEATTQAELRGKTTVGIEHLFYYFQAARNALINLTPEPRLANLTDVMITVNADHGPMQYAFSHGEAELIAAAKRHGMGLLAISSAFAGGELGYYARRLASEGLISLAFANSPAVMSVGGSRERLLGTNPLCYSVPLPAGQALIIDQASSSTARVNFQKYAQRQEPIPANWALDKHGQPTTDAAAALDGILLPFGGYKGGNIALLVELLAMFGGGDSSYEAAPYYAGERRQGIGATIIAIDSTAMPEYPQRSAALLDQFVHDHDSNIRITQLELPATRRVEVRATLWSQLKHLAAHGQSG